MKHDAFISAIMAMLLFALSYAINERWAALLGAVALGLLWLLGQARGWDWTPHLGLVGYVCLAAVSTLDGLSAAWSLAGVVATLVAWNFDCFTQSLRAAPRVEGEDAMRRALRRRLLLVAALAILPALVAVFVRFELSFGWTLLLALLAIIGLSRAVGALRRVEE